MTGMIITNIILFILYLIAILLLFSAFNISGDLKTFRKELRKWKRRVRMRKSTSKE